VQCHVTLIAVTCEVLPLRRFFEQHVDCRVFFEHFGETFAVIFSSSARIEIHERTQQRRGGDDDALIWSIDFLI
jgi:hypothetical protein